MMNGPNISQVDRDRLADVGLGDVDDETGTDEGALHHEEGTPS